MRRVLGSLFVVACFASAASLHADEVHYPRLPGPRDFVMDTANLVSAQDVTRIRTVCGALLDEKQVPIIVVTIPSLATYGAGDWSIERYAMNLFDEWGIGRQDWNHGMLLLVSKGDRKARIELGDAWGHREDGQAREIMDTEIIRRFRRGAFSEGIVAGVEALARVARGLGPPPRPGREPGGSTAQPWWKNPFWWGVGLFVMGTLISVARQGRDGWGYKAWAAIFMILGAALMILALLSAFSGGRSGGGSGGLGGGSFGGGSSGGGGATGSW